jgi:threonine dehydratase
MKIDATRAFGAEVVLYDRAGEDREAIGAAISSERGLTLIRPYDEPEVIAGQGTCGLEIAWQAAEAGVETGDVLVCCGGGGFTSGVALALAEAAPGLRVRPAEPEGFDDTARSLVSGRIERNPAATGSICDAILSPAPGNLTFPIMAAHCGPGIQASDQECLRAMALAWARLKIVVEPGGAAALASALFHGDRIEGDAVIATASGGNVDPAMFRRALDAGAAA